MLILDIGLRISEALNLRNGDIDFDNLVVISRSFAALAGWSSR